MSNPTTPFGWQMPTATDLVTDLPADFEVFGQAVATSMADLLGGTTGQVLKKNTNADMDFVWSADSAGMTNPMTTSGDTIYGGASGTPTRLGIGSTGNILTVSGGLPVWAAPAGGGKVLQVVHGSTTTQVNIATTTFTDTTLTATITPSSVSSRIYVVYSQQYRFYIGAAGPQGSGVRLLRNSTVIQTFGTGGGGAALFYAAAGGAEFRITTSGNWVDSPATTSATTYKIQARPFVTSSSGEVIAQDDASNSSITLLEIGA
jgi:hypothetical protein